MNNCDNNSNARLSLRRMQIDTYHENVAYMHRDCEIYRAEGFKALSKVEVRANSHNILATLNVVDDHALLTCNELGLSSGTEALLSQLPGQDEDADRMRRVLLALLPPSPPATAEDLADPVS